MNNYDTAFIKSYIVEHQDEISSVVCGMWEDWGWTTDEVFSGGEFVKGYDWSSKSIKVAGITGPTWATPVMEVIYKSGKSEIIPCFFDDGERASPDEIARQEMFAIMTGRRPYGF